MKSRNNLHSIDDLIKLDNRKSVVNVFRRIIKIIIFVTLAAYMAVLMITEFNK